MPADPSRYDATFYEKAVGHAVNTDILAWLKRESTPRYLAKTAPWDRRAFVIHTHSDIGGLLTDAAETLPEHYSELLFGFDVIANSPGVVCAVASSMSSLFFRLTEQTRELALTLGGEAYPNIGHEWVAFSAWSVDVNTAGDPDQVKEFWRGSWRRDMENRTRIAFFRFWCEHGFNHANQLAQ